MKKIYFFLTCLLLSAHIFPTGSNAQDLATSLELLLIDT